MPLGRRRDFVIRRQLGGGKATLSLLDVMFPRILTVQRRLYSPIFCHYARECVRDMRKYAVQNRRYTRWSKSKDLQCPPKVDPHGLQCNTHPKKHRVWAFKLCSSIVPFIITLVCFAFSKSIFLWGSLPLNGHYPINRGPGRDPGDSRLHSSHAPRISFNSRGRQRSIQTH